MLEIRDQEAVRRVRLARPEAANAIDAGMVAALQEAVRLGEERGVTVLVVEGQPEVFCTGGDLAATAAGTERYDPEPLYALWQRLAEGPFVSVALVRGRANAGGVGLAAACDIVLCDRGASFSLSEMLFGLFPACVLPFLARRVGRQKAHYLTLNCQPIGVTEALACGLADAAGDDAEALLRSHLVRLRRLGREAIGGYKRYRAELDDCIAAAKPPALAANREMFANPRVQANIRRYVTESKFPWE